MSEVAVFTNLKDCLDLVSRENDRVWNFKVTKPILLKDLANLENSQFAIDSIVGPTSISYPSLERYSEFNSDLLVEGWLLRLQVPRSKSRLFFAENVSDLISDGRFLTTPPPEFYIFDENFYSLEPNATVPTQIQNYFAVIDLSAILKSVSDYSTENAAFILLQNKIEIPFIFTTSDLDRAVPVKQISDFLSEIGQSSVRRQTVRSAIRRKLLHVVPKEIRFSWLIQNLEEVFEDVADNFSIYISELTVDAVLEETKKKCLTTAIEVDNLISGIQTKILAIPAAAIFVASQFAEDGTLGKHIAVVLGGTTFSVLMLILISNQLDSLRSIKRETGIEIDHHSEFGSSEISRKLEKVFHALKKRQRKVQIILLLIAVIASFPAISSIILFKHYENETYTYLSTSIWDFRDRIIEYTRQFF